MGFCHCAGHCSLYHAPQQVRELQRIPAKLSKNMQISSLYLHSKQPFQEAYLNAFQLVKIRLVSNDGPDLPAIA